MDRFQADILSSVRAFWAHAFDQDEEYLEGWNSIVQNGMLEGKLPEEIERLSLQSRLFFWNSKNQTNLTLQDVLEEHPGVGITASTSNGTSDAAASSSPAETSTLSSKPHVEVEEQPNLTFAQLKLLIEQGRTDEIPNNKHIPDIISDAAPSVSGASTMKKPWES